MKISDARYKANKKWNKENYARLELTVSKEMKQIITEFAKSRMQSTNSFILEAVNEKIKRESTV